MLYDRNVTRLAQCVIGYQLDVKGSDPVTTKKVAKGALSTALSSKESEALRITRALARDSKLSPRKAPVFPDQSNRYAAP